MPPFWNIQREGYKLLLRHMIDQETLIQSKDLTLLVGLRGEGVTYGRDFQSVFKARRETEVMFGDTTVNTVQGEPGPGTLVALAGRVWRITRMGNG